MTFEGHFSTIVTLCVQLTRDLLAIAEFLVNSCFVHCVIDFCSRQVSVSEGHELVLDVLLSLHHRLSQNKI